MRIDSVRWNSPNHLTVRFRDATGNAHHPVLSREQEADLQIELTGRAWAFDAPGDLFRLASEAQRIRLAHLFDPFLAVHLSLLEPLPHQLQAVYSEMLPRQPLRFLLADDPGAGKTIMAGLFIKELQLRGDLVRCLIVAPGGLVGQWQDELAEKFGLHFDILTRDLVEASRGGDPFATNDLLIARLDHLSRNEELLTRLGASHWDLVVVDEAHRMSAHYYGTEIKRTRRYELGQTLGDVTRNLLLMTATPHSGKEEDFQLFMALLDPDRFEGRFRDGVHEVDTSDLMRRMIKEKLLRFDGTPLFPERIAYSVPYQLSPMERHLYDQVTDYVTFQMNRADDLSAHGDGRRGNRVGFALTVLQRRLASSPEAIYRSLTRRRERLEQELVDARRSGVVRELAGIAVASPSVLAFDADPEDLDADDLPSDEEEAVQNTLAESATAARSVAELDAEITALRGLEKVAREVRLSGTDKKWQEFSSLLQDRPEMRDGAGRRRKILVFTEHRDTLNYLRERLTSLIGRQDAVTVIHGGMPREDRKRSQEVFTQDPECIVLLATDAAGEGINLQRAHLVVNYDLPWNPTRIEQRFGRVHRIGQTEVCHMWNLVADETREGAVYQRLFEKLEEQRKALKGQVFDVLGRAFQGTPLRDLLIQAIRYGNQPEVRARLNQVIDASVGEGLPELIGKHALASEVMATADIAELRRMMQEAKARRLQPRFVRNFFLHAFAHFGGKIVERETGRFEIRHVPADVRHHDRVAGSGHPVVDRYERVTFDKELIRLDDRPPADLLCPGHPLVDAVTDLTIERYGSLLRQGAVLIDESDPGTQPRLLVYLEQSIQDARTDRFGRPLSASRRFEFVSITPDREVALAGPAPYLDARPASTEELARLQQVLRGDWLQGDVEQYGVDYAVEHSVPDHLAEVRTRVTSRVATARAAVRDRLTREINHWDARTSVLERQLAAGKQPKMNPDRARRTAEDLSARLRARMADLDREEALQPQEPRIVGGALIVPAGLLDQLNPATTPPMHARDTTIVERRAVDAVLAAERALGRTPMEMAHNNPGYDIQTEAPDGTLSFIEVKGRIAGAPEFSLTNNEVLFALQNRENYTLAIVEVAPEGGEKVRYLREPFPESANTGFELTRFVLSWDAYWAKGHDPS